MTRRNQIALGLLLAVLALLVLVIYSNRQPVAIAVASGARQTFVPIAVENPALRLDLIENLKKFQYAGPRRNIFSTMATPAPAPVEVAAAPIVAAPPVPLPGPAPLVVPATFFGRVTDRASGSQRAFFSEGDNVYVVGLGDTLMNRFRVVQIGDSTTEVEEIASGRRTTLTMEKPAS
jgi:hypothetical protein